MADDGEILVASDNDAIYIYEGKSFGFNQISFIWFANMFCQTVDITGDGNFLLIVNFFSQIIILERGSDGYNNFETIIHPNNINLSSGAITDDHQWVVYGTSHNSSSTV